MNRRFPNRIFVSLCLAAVAGCAPAVDVQAEAERLMETSRAWSRIAASGEVVRMMDHWTDDASILSSGAPELKGKAAIRESLEASFALPGYEVGWEPIRAEVSSSGDLGYVLERIEMKVTGPDGRPMAQSWRAITIWRKGQDGQWRNSLEMTSEPPPR